MEIRREHCRTLVFNCYRHYELTHAGSRLRIGELDDCWAHTGMRRSDLGTTLDELVKARLLRAELTAAGIAYYLTDAGAEYIRNHPETPELRRALYQLSRRSRSGNALRPERRGVAVSA